MKLARYYATARRNQDEQEYQVIPDSFRVGLSTGMTRREMREARELAIARMDAESCNGSNDDVYLCLLMTPKGVKVIDQTIGLKEIKHAFNS